MVSLSLASLDCVGREAEKRARTTLHVKLRLHTDRICMFRYYVFLIDI